jgi:hypothetical protein
MKITITQSSGTEYVWGVNCPPYDGKCEQCEKPTAAWAGKKQGKWLCLRCNYNNKQGK